MRSGGLSRPTSHRRVTGANVTNARSRSRKAWPVPNRRLVGAFVDKDLSRLATLKRRLQALTLSIALLDGWADTLADGSGHVA